jgi:hypothetical protein
MKTYYQKKYLQPILGLFIVLCLSLSSLAFPAKIFAIQDCAQPHPPPSCTETPGPTNPTPSTTDQHLFSICQPGDPNYQPNSTVCQDHSNQSDNPINHAIRVAANIVALLTGVAAVIIIIISGIGMITSSGNTEAVTNARKRLVAATIGLVIVGLAWTIITFLVNKLIT